MLINLTIKNWKSFKDTIDLTSKATKEKRHRETLSHIKKYSLRLLPISAIFGLNATGKSNLIDSVNFAKEFITDPKRSFNHEHQLGYVPFKLDEKSLGEETYFSFLILVNNGIYNYSFSLLNNLVKSETLNKFNYNKIINIYKRIGKEVSLGKINKNYKKEKELFDYLRASLPEKELFLTYAVQHNVEELIPIFNWFKNQLHIIKPNSFYEQLSNLGNQMEESLQALSNILLRLEVGIDHLVLKASNQDTRSKAIDANRTLAEIAPKEALEQMKNILKITSQKQIFQELTLVHKSLSRKEKHFTFDAESEGTKRLLDLVPAFYHLTNPSENIVYLIDDLDQSLHSNLTQCLISYFLDGCNTTNRSQLIFSTHDLTLLNLDLLRTDEIWFTERYSDSSTGILPLSLYKGIKKDKYLINSYKEGRFSHTPSCTLINPRILVK